MNPALRFAENAGPGQDRVDGWNVELTDGAELCCAPERVKPGRSGVS